jgi:hypothetical protein
VSALQHPRNCGEYPPGRYVRADQDIHHRQSWLGTSSIINRHSSGAIRLFMTEHTMRSTRRVSAFFLCLVPLAAGLLLPVAFWDQGCIEREALTFIRQYSSDRSMPQKIFDPHANDLGTYQARELSYAIDLVDAYAYPHLAALIGVGFSVPLSALLASTGLVLTATVGALRATALPALTLTSVLTCFVTSFGFVSTMGLFYRSAKPMLTLVVVAWTMQLLSAVNKKRRTIPTSDQPVVTVDSAVTFTLAIVAGLLDRQGVVFVATASGVLAVHYRLTREYRDLLISTAAALVALQLYNFVLAPLIVYSLNGYWPTFAYQSIPARELASLHKHLLKAIALLIMNSVSVLGGPIVGSTLAIGIAGAVVHRVKRSRIRRWGDLKEYLLHTHRGRIVLYVSMVLWSQVMMFALMIARHGYVYRWVDHRYWYYPMPYLGLALVGSLILANHRWSRLSGYQRIAINVVLMFVVVGNCMTLTEYRQTMIEGPWFGPVYTQCELLKASLRTGDPAVALNAEYKAFLDYSRSMIASLK